jgi:hypothetical protein
MKNRREFLKAAGSSLVVSGAMRSPAIAAVAATESNDETSLTKWYDVDRSITNLENAYWNVMAQPVADEYFRKLTYVNRRNVPFVRGVLPNESLPVELERVRASVANLINAEVDEVALTRCGTESLQDLISGYNGLKPGDTIIFGDLDYDSMQNAMLFLKERSGVEVVTLGGEIVLSSVPKRAGMEPPGTPASTSLDRAKLGWLKALKICASKRNVMPSLIGSVW